MKTFTSLKEIVSDPENVFKVQLRKRRFQTIPLEIDSLPNLFHLDVRQNAINSIPKEFYSLKNILELNLSENKLESISSDVCNLFYLQRLDVSNNLLTIIPEEIGKLQDLIELQLNNNSLESIPSELGKLIKLQECSLASNKLHTLPEEIGGLLNLTTLNVSNNNLTYLPDSLGSLPNLVSLDVSHNPLISLPNSILTLKSLIELNLSSCHSLLSTSTIEILASIPNLQTVIIHNVSTIDWKDFFQIISKNTSLRSITLSIDTIPAEASLLQNPDIELHFVNDTSKSIKKAHFQIRKFIESSLEARWRLVLFSLYLENTIEAVEYAKIHFTIEELFDFLDHTVIEVRNIGILALSDLLGHPFKEEFHPIGSVFYISGRFRNLDIEQAKQRLKDYDVKIQRDFDHTVQFYIAGFGSGKEAYQKYSEGLKIAFEPHLEWLLPHIEKAFLEENSTAKISENLKRLLFDADAANVKIALNTIDSCGCSPEIMGIVLGIFCFHERASLRKKAFTIIQKYTSKIFLETFTTHWKSSMRDKIVERDIIDVICTNFKTEEVFHHATFFDTAYRLTKRFKEMVLALGADSFREVITVLCKNNTLTTELGSFWISKGFQKLSLCKEVTHLDFTNSNLRFVLPEIGLVTQLVQLTLKQNSIQTLPKEIGNLRNLTELNIYKNKITKLPPELGNLKKLTQLFLSNNQLTFLPVELLQLTQLSQISLWGNRFDYYEKEKIKNMFPTIVISF